MRRRALLASVSGGNESGISFPAVIEYAVGNASEEVLQNNVNIALYVAKKYPNMPQVNVGGEYLPISDDIHINGTSSWDGKVIGIAQNIQPPFLGFIFYTQGSLSGDQGCLVLYPGDDFLAGGVTWNWSV